MKLSKTLMAIAILLCPLLGFSQNADSLLQEGISLHDQGEFDKAIEKYNQALEQDPNSALIYYEISLSYYSKGDYERSIEYSDLVLDQKVNNNYQIYAYINKASSLDMLGKTKESIKLFHKAIKKTGGHYLLYSW